MIVDCLKITPTSQGQTVLQSLIINFKSIYFKVRFLIAKNQAINLTNPKNLQILLCFRICSVIL